MGQPFTLGHTLDEPAKCATGCGLHHSAMLWGDFGDEDWLGWELILQNRVQEKSSQVRLWVLLAGASGLESF